jgi:predicted ABC-type ATPase
MYVVAGPNGAGKSTLAQRARRILGIEPIDADTIQRETGTSSADAWAEGLRRCRRALDEGTSFLIETTLAGRASEKASTYLRLMKEAKDRGFQVELMFIALENADAHVARVADRVAAGLHDIPEAAIRDRYERSLSRAGEALRIAHRGVLIDNSSVTDPFRVIVEIDNGQIVGIGHDDFRTRIAGVRWVERVLLRFLIG